MDAGEDGAKIALRRVKVQAFEISRRQNLEETLRKLQQRNIPSLLGHNVELSYSTVQIRVRRITKSCIASAARSSS